MTAGEAVVELEAVAVGLDVALGEAFVELIGAGLDAVLGSGLGVGLAVSVDDLLGASLGAVLEVALGDLLGAGLGAVLEVAAAVTLDGATEPELEALGAAGRADGGTGRADVEGEPYAPESFPFGGAALVDGPFVGLGLSEPRDAPARVAGAGAD